MVKKIGNILVFQPGELGSEWLIEDIIWYAGN